MTHTQTVDSGHETPKSEGSSPHERDCLGDPHKAYRPLVNMVCLFFRSYQEAFDNRTDETTLDWSN